MKTYFIAALLSAVILLTGETTTVNAMQHEDDVPVTGGWMSTEKSAITDDVQQVFDKAMENFVGVDYKPVAYLGYQVVAGKNHCLLCQAKVVYPNARPYYALVYIYEDLEDNATITNIAKLDIAELSQKEN